MATRELRTRLILDGEKEYKDQVKSINQNMKVLGSEMKKVTSAFGTNQKSVQGLTAQNKVLSQRVDEQKQKIGVLGDALKAAQEKYANSGKAVQELKGQLAKAREEYGQNSQEVKELEAALTRAETVYEKNKSAVSNWQIQLNNAEADLNKTKTTIAENEAAIRKFTAAGVENAAQLEKNRKNIENLSKTLSAAGKGMEKVGGKLTTYVTAPLIAAGGFAAKAGIEFESAFAGVEKTVDATTEELAGLERGIRDMALEIPASTTEIAGVAEAAGQLGIETENILSFTRTMIDMGESTNLSAEDAATQLAKLANITRMSQADFSKLGSVIVDLGNHFATNEADIVSMATRLASTGAVVGLTEPQIMAIATALSSVGIEAEAGGSAISKLLKQMEVSVKTYGTASKTIDATGYSLRELEMIASHDGKAFKFVAENLGLTAAELKRYMSSASSLEQFADVAGVSADQFVKAWGKDAVGALSMFIGGLNDTKRTGKSAVELLNDMGLTEVRLSNAVLSLASSDGILTKALDTSNAAWDENEALTKEASKRYETMESQLEKTRNALNEAGIVMAQELMPYIRDGAVKVKELAEKFASLDKETQKNILKFAAYAAVGGPVIKTLGGIFSASGKVVKGFGKVSSKIKEWSTAAKTASSAAEGVSKSAGGIASMLGSGGPVVAAIAVAAAVIGGALYASYKKAEEEAKAVAEGLKEFLDAGSAFSEGVSTARSALEGFNTEILISNEKMQEYEDKIMTAREKIHTIAETAASQSRKLTDAERREIEKLIGMIDSYTSKKLEAYQQQQKVVLSMVEHEEDMSEGHMLEYVKAAEDTYQETLNQAKARLNDDFAAAEQYKESNKELYEQLIGQAKAYYSQAEAEAIEHQRETMTAIANSYYDQTIASDTHMQNLMQSITENNQKIVDLKKQREELEAEVRREGTALTVDEYQRRDDMLRMEISDTQDKIGEIYASGELNSFYTWMHIASYAEQFGGKVSEESEKAAEEVGKAFDNLPKEVKEIFANMMEGGVQGITENMDKLVDTAGGVVTAVTRKFTGPKEEGGFDEHSPSKVSEEIFDYFIQGGVKGMEERKKDIVAAARSVVQDTRKQMEAISAMRYSLAMPDYGTLQAKPGPQAFHTAGISPGLQSAARTAPGPVSAPAGPVTIPVTITHFYNNRDQDVQALSNQIAVNVRRQLMAKGGMHR